MIDFQNGSVFKLKPDDISNVQKVKDSMLIDGEEMFASFVGIRDRVIFTTKRVIAINVQGVTGKKKDFTSLPYSKIQAFSVETAGTLDLDCELDLFFNGLGKVRFEFKSGVDIVALSKKISEYVL
ncbi:MAG: PH domain-containing protein [Acetivibrionales bacterium]|nr:PH domain-containing protein [Clostridiaceae bacterium]